jgi:hypothetical protein
MMTTHALTRFDWLELSPEPLQEFLETCVAGAGYVPDIQDRVSELVIGGPLVLQREPWNPYDSLAIVVLSPAGHKLGYIPRSQNRLLARRMDQNGQVQAVLSALAGAESRWPQIYLKVWVD